MKTKRGMRFSIKLQILLSSILVNILICIFMGIAVYQYVQRSYIKTASEDTLSICKIAAGQLNGNLLGLLEAGSDDSYANTVMLKDMQKVMDSANVNSIYTIAERSGSYVYLSSINIDNISMGSAVVSSVDEQAKNAISQDGYVSSEIHTSATGTNYITAYAPIFCL